MEEIRYSGNWEILDKEFFGNLIINDKKGIIRLILHDRDKIESLFDNKDIPTRIKFIKGKIIPYGIMILLDATVIKRNINISASTKTVELDIDYCINCDAKDYDDVKFSKMEFRLSNTLAWSNLNGLSTKYGKRRSYTFKYKFKKSISYSIDKNTTISFVPYFHEGPNMYSSEETIIKQYIKIRITSRKNKDIYFYLDVLSNVKNLIEIAIGENIDIKEIVGYKRNDYILFDNKRRYRDIKIYSKDSYKDNYKEPFIGDMLFCLPDLVNNSKLLNNWFSKYELLKPVLNLYNSCVVYENMPKETIFLNIVQALETYHSRFICNDKEEYQKRVTKILDKVPDESKEFHYDKLFDKTQQDTNYIILKSRLNDLMIANFDIQFFNTSESDFPYDFVEKVVDTRHYYTHYSKTKEEKILKGEEFSFAIECLRIVLAYYILTEIGFEKEFINRKINEKQSNIRYAWGMHKENK